MKFINRTAIWNVSLESAFVVSSQSQAFMDFPAGEVGPIHFSSLHLITFQLNTIMESSLCSVHPSQRNITWNLILVEGNFLWCKVGVSKCCATQKYFAFWLLSPNILVIIYQHTNVFCMISIVLAGPWETFNCSIHLQSPPVRIFRQKEGWHKSFCVPTIN